MIVVLSSLLNPGCCHGMPVISPRYHEMSSVLLKQYMSPASDGDEPTPYTALMNGLGQGYCVVTGAGNCSYSYIKGQASFCDNPKTKLRIINAGGFAVFNISIDNHRWAVAFAAREWGLTWQNCQG